MSDLKFYDLPFPTPSDIEERFYAFLRANGLQPNHVCRADGVDALFAIGTVPGAMYANWPSPSLIVRVFEQSPTGRVIGVLGGGYRKREVTVPLISTLEQHDLDLAAYEVSGPFAARTKAGV